MVIVQLRGGLGNQMFQYAAGRRLAVKHKTRLKMDLSVLLDRTPRQHFVYRDFDLDIFKINGMFSKRHELILFSIRLRRVVSKFFGESLASKRYVKEPHFDFWPALLDAPNNVYLDGHWQSEKYFSDIEPVIREDFTFRRELDAISMSMAEKIRATNSVCVNVRRHDFAHNPIAFQHHGVCSLDYYRKAEEIMLNKVYDPHFFVFSDDIAWCAANLSFGHDFTIVSHDYSGEKFDYYLQLMTLCKHYIIANSTFAWWAAWLNPESSKIVVAPRKWVNNRSINTKDLIPDGWIRI